jgi:hypothetical protein
MIKKFEYSRTHVEEVAWKDWRALAIAEANDTTAGKLKGHKLAIVSCKHQAVIRQQMFII